MHLRLLQCGLKPDEEDIYYFNVRRRNGYGRLKNSKIVGIGFRKYTKLPEWKLYDDIEFDGATYELWCYYEDSMMIDNEYQDALNCYQLQFYDLEILEDFYNCLRCELNAKKQGKQK